MLEEGAGMQDVLRKMGSHLKDLCKVCVGIMIVHVMSCILPLLIPSMILQGDGITILVL